ncbi:hypothetical protein, partial [Corynebacterium diphtheriae]|uniref:hypothetical protein n=1 Tax=Corynebacterium diphtheriae TaxID=1717 RepID=UPI000DD65CEC
VLECIDCVSDVGGVALVGVGGRWWALVGVGGRWWALVGVGGRATPAHPRKRRHFTPNLLKRPIWK